jgi:hypothetical protein
VKGLNAQVRTDAPTQVGSREWRGFIIFSSIENSGIDECWIRCAVRCSCSSMIPRSPRGLIRAGRVRLLTIRPKPPRNKIPGHSTLNKTTQPCLAVAPSWPLRPLHILVLATCTLDWILFGHWMTLLRIFFYMRLVWFEWFQTIELLLYSTLVQLLESNQVETILHFYDNHVMPPT